MEKRFVRLTHFVRRQIKEIHQGGLPVFLRKVCISLLMVPLALAVLLVRALRPLILIRFGPLRSERIGHFAANTEVYLCERNAGLHGSRNIDIFYHTLPVSNYQLKKMWDRTIYVSSLARLLDRLNRRIPGGERHIIPWREYQDRDIHDLLSRMPPHLAFTPKEERLGLKALREMGIAEQNSFVCFYARDSAYMDAAFPDRDWRYHDHRDVNIHRCIPAAEEMARRGYYAIRMGAIVKEALMSDNPKIIDYATKYRSDFLDIYLCAKCRFFLISSGAGILHVAMIFRRPLAFVNWIPIRALIFWGANNLFIPKKLWLRRERRFMTFREICESAVGRFSRREEYEQARIDVVENTPEEISALAMEMDERLKGTWQTTEEDERLQQDFWLVLSSLYRQHFKEIKTRIGTEFLRQNRHLLH